MKYRLMFVLMLTCLAHLRAGDDGGQAGAFLRYGAGVRALGMGRTFVGISDDASAVYWNPAGMLGAERTEIASMYSNLYYDSRYAFMGLIIPRPLAHGEKFWQRWLFGPGTAWGFGWAGLNMAGFEQRTSVNEYLGQFDIGENAWMISFAREHVSAAGIFRAGLTADFVNQQWAGLNTSAMPLEGTGTDWSGGLDAGLTFQPIDAPVFRVIALKYLLPLRLGLSMRNIVQPGWETSDNGRQSFPRVLRYGFSYRCILRDWMPDDWNVKPFLGESAILLALDREHISDTDAGTFFGMEGQVPLRRINVWLFPRFGVNTRSEGHSLGFGLSVPFTTAILKLDYSSTAHPYLSNDSRLSISVQFYKQQGAQYFRDRAKQASLSREMMDYNHLVLSKYPNDAMDDAVADIATTADRNYEKRLYALVGGMRHAELLLEDANILLRQNDVGGAQKKALESAKAYAPFYLQSENYLTDSQMEDYGEALIISGEMQDATLVLGEVENRTIRSDYLLGTGYKGIHDPRAIDAFDRAVRKVKQDKNSMMTLSYLGLAESLVRDNQFEPAQTALSSLLNFGDKILDENYPRHPIFGDRYIQDDAMYLMGLTQMASKNYDQGLATLYKTFRYFPGLKFGQRANLLVDEMQEAVGRNDYDHVDKLVQDLLLSYYAEHDPSNKQADH
ncbi:hypothetical protein JW948_18755 [bacterium]|nr:hypothetical protein [bacterium]